MKELKVIKSTIKIVSPDEKLNKQLLGVLQMDHDCFGTDYSEMYDECKKCTILAEYEDRRAALWEFCKEICQSEGEKEREEEEEEEQEVKEQEKEEEEKQEGKEQEQEEEEKKGGKEKLSGMASFAKELLDQGNSEKEVEKIITKKYLDKGRNEVFASKRAKLYIKMALEDTTQKETAQEEREVNDEMARSNNIDFAKGLLKEGKPETEILEILKKKYLDKGKDEKFATKRAQVYLKLAKK